MAAASALALALLFVLPAGAEAGYQLKSHFGNGIQIGTPSGIAENGTQNVFVGDASTGFLVGFDGSGTLLGRWYGENLYPLGETSGVAAPENGPLTGDAVVVDREKGRVVVFNPSGTVLATWPPDPPLGPGSTADQFLSPGGISASPISPYDVYVADSGNSRIKEFNVNGSLVRRFGNANTLFVPSDVAVGPSGTVYVTTSSPPRVNEYSADGTRQGGFTPKLDGAATAADRIAISHDGHIYLGFQNKGLARFSSRGKFLNMIAPPGAGFGQYSVSNVTDVDVVTVGNHDQIAVLQDFSPRVELFTENHPDTTAQRTSPLNTKTQTFDFTSTINPATYQCRLMLGTTTTDWSSCANPYSVDLINDGAYHLQVRALDKNKLADNTPADIQFTVDSTAPTTTIDSGPSGPTADPTPTYAFHSGSDGGSATFQCRVDSAPFAGCVSPYTAPHLGDGTHSFDVRAVDSTGNKDASPSIGTSLSERRRLRPRSTVPRSPTTPPPASSSVPRSRDRPSPARSTRPPLRLVRTRSPRPSCPTASTRSRLRQSSTR